MKEFVVLREFKFKGIRCVSVRNLDDKLLGFYVGSDEDWIDGIVNEKDLKGVDEIKKEIIKNVE